MQLKTVSAMSALSGAILLSGAYYLEWALHVAPCPLCLLQRFIFGLLILVFLIGTCFSLRSRSARSLYGSGIIILGVLGLAIALRQVWLQHLPPDQQPACGASFAYMLKHFPWHQTLLTMIKGAGDCSDVVWRFVGLSIPAWSAICFSLYIVVGAYCASTTKKL